MLFQLASRRTLAAAVAAGVGLAVLPLVGAGATTRATATTTLGSDIPHLAAGVVRIGAPAASRPLHIGILFSGQDAAGEAQLLHELATPGTSGYGHPLTPAQFDTRFGPTTSQVDTVRSWLAAGHVGVPAGQATQGQYLLASGTVGSVSKLLRTRFATYRTAKGSTFIANISAPTVPAGLGIVRVLGLDTAVVASPLLTTPAVPNPPIGIATNPDDLWKLYNQPATNTGQGQSLATLLWGSMQELASTSSQACPYSTAGDGYPTASTYSGGTVASDLVDFEVANELPEVPLCFVTQPGYVDPGTSSDTLSDELTETDLDMQAATGMAPEASQITGYYADDDEFVDVAGALGEWLNDPTGALQMSASFGGCENLDYILEGAGLDAGFAQAEAEGRTVFVASGDNGSGCENPTNAGPSPLLDVEYPAASPFVVAVGGTVPTEDTHSSSTSEYGWDGSGGGTSLWEPARSWQSTVVSGLVGHGVKAVEGRCLGNTSDPSYALNAPLVSWLLNTDIPPSSLPPTGVSSLPSTTGLGALCRGVPDVAAQSGDGLLGGYNFYLNGAASEESGTSLAAPLWQGMWARVNAAAPAGDAKGAGFAAPVLYAAGTGANYTNDFYEITLGDNGAYQDLPGWNYVSGFGSPNLTNLMTAIDGGTTPTDPTAGPVAPGSGSGSGSGGGASGSTPAAACPTPQITGQPGDATSIAGEASDGESSLSQADLDILSGNLVWNDTAKALTATITVQNLSATPPGGLSDNEYFRYSFTDGGAWYLMAQRAPGTGGVAATTFAAVSSGVTGSSTPLTGSFDPSTNTITVTLPATGLTAIGGPTLEAGQQLTAMSIDAQRDVGAATLTADSAEPATTCGYTLP